MSEEAGTPLSPPTDEAPKPTCGMDLVKQLDCAPDEGVIVALLTEPIERVTTREVPVLDKKGHPMFLVEADIFAWGRRVIDLISEREQKVKWWRVKEACDVAGGQMVPVRWEGPIGEIPEKYFDPRNVLMIRFYGFGPAFFPLEKPVIREDEEQKKALANAVSAAAECG